MGGVRPSFHPNVSTTRDPPDQTKRRSAHASWIGYTRLPERVGNAALSRTAESEKCRAKKSHVIGLDITAAV